MSIVAVMEGPDGEAGTGSGFGRAVLICAGVAALVACLLTFVTTILQAKNYRKPLLQRHVIRIFMMVPIFSIASWTSLTSLQAAYWVDPFRDVYEAFTLYTFFQLLVNFLGGERSLIIMMYGRAPVDHLWPLNHFFGKVDISDPHTFLSIKRGVLQYTYIKPVLAIATIIMKATGTFREGVLSVTSGYMWTSIIYNVSICWSLYDLALFWVCMSEDLQPFRPMPKFLCIKGIIFASWWQGFFLSILVWLGAIPSIGGGYTADNLAAAIQDALICFEMPLFAVSHWYAFSWKDYADKTISDARMPIRYALRDAFGPRDLIEDAKETLSGTKYDYRHFDAQNNIMAHEQSSSREARMREGMRYERGGRGKYWLPEAGHRDAKQPLLSRLADSHARTMSPGSHHHHSRERNNGYGTTQEAEEPELDPDEENLYRNARAMEFGDYHYPVINTHYATRDDQLYAEPNTISASTNRAVLQPSRANRERRKSRIKNMQEEAHQHDDPARRDSRDGGAHEGPVSSLAAKGKDKIASLPVVGTLFRQSSSDSTNSHSSQLVDLVVEDEEAERIERVRARKEGGPGWNAVEQKHFVQVSPQNDKAEVVRQGFNPDRPEKRVASETHTLDSGVEANGGHERGDAGEDEQSHDQLGHDQPWEERHYGDEHDKPGHSGDVDTGPFDEERDAWGR